MNIRTAIISSFSLGILVLILTLATNCGGLPKCHNGKTHKWGSWGVPHSYLVYNVYKLGQTRTCDVCSYVEHTETNGFVP
jgi:hypothetical protein